MADDPMQLLADHLGAVELLACPVCDTTTPASRLGHPALCRRCTEAELGLGTAENAARIARGWTVARWQRENLPELEWLPVLSWRQRRARRRS